MTRTLHMCTLFKINAINLLLCLSLIELFSSAKSDHVLHNTIKHNDVYQLYSRSSSFIADTNIHKASEQFNHRLSTQIPLEETMITDAEENVLEDSMFTTQRENSEKCLLDSIKMALIWWSYSNGTLKKSNLNFLSQDEILDLSYRNISNNDEVLKAIFNTTQNMTIVAFSLAYNNLTSAPYHTLQMTGSNLKYLSLKGNSFKYIKHAGEDYTSSHCFLDVDDWKLLKNRRFKGLFTKKRYNSAWATFPYMSSLLELDISDCHIEYLNKRSFKNLTNLRNLYVSHNKILTIHSDTFLYTPSLQVLDLSFTNVYSSFMNYVLDSPNFESILKFGSGVSIEQHLFRYVPKLVYLDLSHSKLSRNSALAFTHIGSNLKYLSLCYTSFPMFGNGMFKNSSLIALDLSGNGNAAFSLTADVFEGLSESLTYLFFEKANIRDLSWLKSLRNLHFLALAGNNINSLSTENFKNLKQLQILDLTSNQVSNWYSQVFKYNENLRILSLRENNINIITSEMLNDFSLLVYLSLGNNNFVCDCLLRELVDIAAVNNQQAQCKGNFWQDLKSNVHIKSIHLSKISQSFNAYYNNSLKNLDIPSLIVYQNLHKFKRSANNFTHQLKKLPKIRFILNALRSYNTTTPCFYQHNSSDLYNKRINSSLLKLQLLDYTEEHYWCYNETQRQKLIGLHCQRSNMISDIEQELSALSTYVLGTVGSIISVAILGIFIYMKRWYIYYYYSSIKSAALLSVVSKDKLNKFNSLCDEAPNMVYDIFISYCESDREWIVEELMPNIEDAANVSVCLHERDFQVGVTILDNIVSCMERSKAITLIISSNFLLSHWCQFEMQLAQQLIFDSKRDNLILVLLEDIPRSKRPKNLQFLMNVKTYLKWSGGKCKTDMHSDECKLFWKRLKLALRNIGLNPSEPRT